MDAQRFSSSSEMRGTDWVLCGVLTVNFALLVLSFVPAFSGFGYDLGVAVRWWRGYRLDGWRPDFVWMCASTAMVLCVCLLRAFVAIVVGGPSRTRKRGARSGASFLCWVWVACFFVLYLPNVAAHLF